MSTHSPAAGLLPEGYATSTVEYEGTTYELTYYRGFVGGARIQPIGPAGPTLEFPLEPGTYRVPQPTPPVDPMVGPDAQSHVKLKGGPNRRAVNFHVDNSPNGKANGFKGPIEGFTAVFNPPSGGPAFAGARSENAAGVVVNEGASQVKTLNVRFAPTGVPFQGIAGAARAFDGPGGGSTTGGPGDETLTVDDNAPVCPPYC